MGKRKLFLVGGIVLLCIVSVLGLLSYKSSHNNEPTNNKTEHSTTGNRAQQLKKSADAVNQKEAARIAGVAKTVNSVDDLKKLTEQDQAKVGLYLAKQLLNTDGAKAKTYTDYLMQRSDAAALAAAQLCFQLTAANTAAQQQCVERANNLARAQGIISASESLPASYFSTPEGQEQG